MFSVVKEVQTVDQRKVVIQMAQLNSGYGKQQYLAVLWLASDAASFVTDSIVMVDGGFTAMTI